MTIDKAKDALRPSRPEPARDGATEFPIVRLRIDRLGGRAEGVGVEAAGGKLHVPYALPGETVSVARDGAKGRLLAVLEPSTDRIAPVCPHFTECGGCAVQGLAPAPYAAWKRSLVVEALSRAGLVADVAPLVEAHGAGRRRATFHSRVAPDGRVAVGFMRARAHEIVPIEACPILEPGLGGALPAARAVADALAPSGKALDLVATATDTGLDLDLRGHGKLDAAERGHLVDIAGTHRLARLSNHGVIVLERARPALAVGRARVEPPPGAFLQATRAGETALVERVLTAFDGARRVADVFAGLGTFALRIAERADVAAFDLDMPALAALDRAARAAPELRRVRVESRDLFRRPLGVEELKAFDAVVLDPPRAGAEAQMRAIAASSVDNVVSVACDAQTFARDAAILVAAGFVCGPVQPIDQFRYSPHVEIVAAFRRTPRKKARRLFG